MVLNGDFFVGERGRKSGGVWSCEEKAIEVGG